eukprot:scaffold207536_cov51-Attheya_sp.AAC.2
MSEKSNEVTGNVTRSSGITPQCTNYGCYHCTFFKRHAFFFCGPCDLYDTVIEKGQVNSESKMYKCVAGHKSFIFPTTKLKQFSYLTLRQLYFCPPSVKPVDTYESDGTDSSEDGSSVDEEIFAKQKKDSPFSLFATTQRILASEFSPYALEPDPAQADSDPMSNPQIAELMAEVDTLKSKVDRLKSELEKENKKNEIKKKRSERNLMVQEDELPQEKKKRQTKSVVNVNLVVALHEAISNVFTKVHQFKNLGGKQVTQALVSVFWTYDGGITQEGLIAKVSRWLKDNVFKVRELLKAMELRGGVLNYEGVEIMRSLEVKGRRNFHHSILPSTSRLQKIQAKMNKIASNRNALPGIQTYGSGENETVNIGVSVDGTNISKRIKTMVGGIKINATQATCPITQHPFFFDPENPDALSGIQMSGPDNPFPADWKPLTVSVELDMEGSWEGTLVGHGVKKFANTCPCQQCNTISDELHVPNPTCCSHWCETLHSERGDDWQCFHHEIITPVKVNEMRTEVESVKQILLVTIDEILQTTDSMKSENVDVPRKTSTSNPKSIHFIPQSLQEKVKFSNRLTRELFLRGLPVLDDMTVRRERLRDALRWERYLRILKTQIEHGTWNSR